ncbi:MAG: hypothetical protein DMF77_09500, partial [Acidobacteria bacterium]
GGTRGIHGSRGGALVTRVEDPAAGFALLRALALYLVSVLTAMAALLAWPARASLATALVVAPASAFALVAGELGAPAAAEAQKTWRARGRLLFAVAYAALVSIAVLVASAVPEPALFAREAIVFAALQPAFLLIAAAMADVRLALVNALALVVLAALRGGPVAALAAMVAFLLIALFLLADNAGRILGAYGARRGPEMDVMLREGASVMAPVTAGLALVLLLAPPQPWAGVRWTSSPPGDWPKHVYVLVFFTSLLGAGAVGLAAQFLRRRQRTPPPAEDAVDVVAVEDEALPDVGPSRRAVMPGSRGAVVRAYVAFLGTAARLGRPRRPDLTPLEYASSLGGVAGLERLTELFMDARYGPEDPRPESVAAAETAAAQALRDVTARWHPRTHGRF